MMQKYPNRIEESAVCRFLFFNAKEQIITGMERNLSYLIIVYITKMEYLEINGADRVKKCVIAIIAAALLINFYGVFHADKAFACNCVSFEPNEAYEHAEAVYTGNKSLYTTRGGEFLRHQF